MKLGRFIKDYNNTNNIDNNLDSLNKSICKSDRENQKIQPSIYDNKVLYVIYNLEKDRFLESYNDIRVSKGLLVNCLKFSSLKLAKLINKDYGGVIEKMHQNVINNIRQYKLIVERV